MLTKGFKDEEQRKINQLLQAALDWDFVPDELENDPEWDALFQQIFNSDLSDIIHYSDDRLLSLLQEHHFNFDNLEHLADLFLKCYQCNGKSIYKNRAKFLYTHIQQENDTFSLRIHEKLNHL